MRSAGFIPSEEEGILRCCKKTCPLVATALNGIIAGRNSDLVLRGLESSHTSLHVTRVAWDGRGNLLEYASLAHLDAGEVTRTHSCDPDLVALVAYDTGFAMLSATGRVWTWGDERYSACLGRDVDDACPANMPCEVTDLSDLPTGPVTKLAAGGYILAAITEGHDLYVWGGHPGRAAIMEGMGGQPSPVVIGEHDVMDVGIGDSHMIALTDDNQVYIIGQNSNGQLGLDVKETSTWTKVELEHPERRHITRVAAGPKNSFIIAQDQ